MASSLVNKLEFNGDNYDIGLWWGLEDELEELKQRVVWIQAVVCEAEKQSSTKEAVKVWLEKLKQTFYDSENLLDLLSTVSLKKQTMTGNRLWKEIRIFFSRFNQFAFSLKVKSIRERIDELVEESKVSSWVKLNLENIPSITRETVSSLPRVFVGREKDKEEIMEKLLCTVNSQENVSVISIVGLGGLGKTTLAQSLFNDEVITSHFQLKLWVCVGENFELKSILEKILVGMKKSKPENLTLESLKNELLQIIHWKKYLLVLDDVWDVNFTQWSNLMNLLSEGPKGGRILMTTRLRSAANVASSVLVHQLKGLSDDESWGLFKQVAFVGDDVPDSSLQEIGKEIVGKLNGVPLVIKTIGRLLNSKEFEADWLSFKDEELSTVNQLEEYGILPILKVLKVDHCKRLEELPKDIIKLVMLRRLTMFGCKSLTYMPRGIGKLTRLEFLSHFVVDKEGRGAKLSELKNLKNLRGYLCITNMGYVKNPKFELQALNLKHLELHWTSSH